jgi:hypothetical protein
MCRGKVSIKRDRFVISPPRQHPTRDHEYRKGLLCHHFRSFCVRRRLASRRPILRMMMTMTMRRRGGFNWPYSSRVRFRRINYIITTLFCGLCRYPTVPPFSREAAKANSVYISFPLPRPYPLDPSSRSRIFATEERTLDHSHRLGHGYSLPLRLLELPPRPFRWLPWRPLPLVPPASGNGHLVHAAVAWHVYVSIRGDMA